MANNNIEKGVTWRFGPARPLQSCSARTRRGTACQKPPLAGKNPVSLARGPIYWPADRRRQGADRGCALETRSAL